MNATELRFHDDGLAELRIDQPGSRANILTRSLWEELETALQPLQSRTDLCGLLLTSAKPSMFVAGADLKFLAAVPAPNDPTVRELMLLGLRVLNLLEAMPFPTCAAIDGPALGGGLELALACDYRIAGTDPRVELGLPEVKLGLIPGWGGTQRLPRLVGLQTAWDLIRTGQTLDRQTAFNIGLVDGVFGPNDERGIALAQFGLWNGRNVKRDPLGGEPILCLHDDPPAIPAAARCLDAARTKTYDTALAVETAAFIQLAGSEDSRERITTFFNSRKSGK